MTLKEKLIILSDAAKYDASCSSSGSTRKNKNGIGSAQVFGLCHSFSADGRCVSLLKILMTNCCIFDCKYCLNRKSNSVKRAVFTPEEICTITINFYKRNYIEGLFLSSGIIFSCFFLSLFFLAPSIFIPKSLIVFSIKSLLVIRWEEKEELRDGMQEMGISWIDLS